MHKAMAPMKANDAVVDNGTVMSVYVTVADVNGLPLMTANGNGIEKCSLRLTNDHGPAADECERRWR